MAKLVEIGGLIKKGLGHGVTERFSKNKDVISVGYANGRASDIFDEQHHQNIIFVLTAIDDAAECVTGPPANVVHFLLGQFTVVCVCLCHLVLCYLKMLPRRYSSAI